MYYLDLNKKLMLKKRLEEAYVSVYVDFIKCSGIHTVNKVITSFFSLSPCKKNWCVSELYTCENPKTFFTLSPCVKNRFVSELYICENPPNIFQSGGFKLIHFVNWANPAFRICGTSETAIHYQFIQFIMYMCLCLN